MSEWPSLALLVFYLYLLVRPERIRRPFSFRIGLLAMFGVLLAWALTAGVGLERLGIEACEKTVVVARTVAVLVAFLAGVAACSPPRTPTDA